MTAPIEFTPLTLALNQQAGRPTDSTNRSEYDILVMTQQHLAEFVERTAHLKDAEGINAVLKPAMSRLDAVIGILRDEFIAYPITSVVNPVVKIRFVGLLPKASMLILARHAVALGEILNNESSDYRTAINEIASFSNELDKFDNVSIEATVRQIDELRDKRDRYSIVIGDCIEHRLRSQLWERYKSILANMESQQATMVSELSKLEDIRRAAEKAAAEVGKRRLKRDFASVGNRETLWGTLWTLFAFTLTVGAIIAPVILFTTDVKFGTLEGPSVTLIKTFIGLPLLAFAAYCGRVASQHRDVARHLNLLVSQIDSITAFGADLSEGVMEEIQLILGRRAFSDPAPTNDDKRSEPATGAGELTLVLSKALDVIDKLGGKGK